MKTLFIKSARKIMQNQKELETKLKVKLNVKGQNISISGNEVNEFFAERVLIALDYPFLVEDALLLSDEDYMFEAINIKSRTHRKDLSVIKGRIIGKEGKTLKVLEELTGAIIAVKDNNVAIIARSDNFEKAVQGVISLIQGSKQGNVYAYLEKANKRI
ncbi:MAG: KH domain-containing protein [Candidatus Pacearchaeota archaeon]|jgi:ribosomal RNA assembly protein